MAAVFADEAMDTIEASARTVLAACLENEAPTLPTPFQRINTVPMRRKIAGRLIQSGRYVV